MELGRHFGGSAVTGLARIDGWPVAILAGDPYQYGAGWTAAASQKVTRFVDLADTFGLPVVHLVDNPGFVIGTESERAATIRHGARALAAIYQARVPWCSMILRKVYGVAGAAHQNAVAALVPLRLAVGELGQPAARRRYRGRVPRRARRRRRPRGETRGDRSSAREATVAVPHRGGVPRSRRSSIHATRAGCCASSRGSRRRAGNPGRRREARGPDDSSQIVTKVPIMKRDSDTAGPYTAHMRTQWLSPGHWSSDIPLDTDHVRLDALDGTRVRAAPRRRPGSRSGVPEPRVHGLEERRRHELRADRDRRRAPRLPRLLEGRRRAAGQERSVDGERAAVPEHRSLGRVGARQLRTRPRHQAGAPGLRQLADADAPRRQQPLQSRRRWLGGASVAGAHRQSPAARWC